MNTDTLISEACTSTANGLSKLIQEVIKILKEEREKGKEGNQIIKGGLIELPCEGEVIVVGDIHGDLKSLGFILRNSSFFIKEGQNLHLIFLGDYGDRGEQSPEVYYAVLKLKSIFPKRVVLLRGNHEGPSNLGVRPHDLPYFLEAKYGLEGREIYRYLQNFFDCLHHCIVVKGKYIMLHGGLPEKTASFSDIAYAHKTHPEQKYLEQILWSDPGEGEQSYPSPRGAGRLFGERITQKILKKLRVKTLIRSHEPCEGVFVNHKGKVLTIFSRKGSPYYNSKAAYLKIDLLEEAKDAYELSREAHLF